MVVRVIIVVGGANKIVKYPEDANTKAVKDDLLGAYGAGILKQQEYGILTETLASGDYQYLPVQHGRFFRFNLTFISLFYHYITVQCVIIIITIILFQPILSY